MKKKCWFVDLTHTAQGVHSRYFPLGIGLVAAYASEKLSDTLDIQLFKFPAELEKKAKESLPEILCFSNYAWNLELTYTFIEAYKKLKNNVIIIMGGPNFPTDSNEKKVFLEQYNLVDFYIFSEGELGFVNLMNILINEDYNVDFVKKSRTELFNCAYIDDTTLVNGRTERVVDLNILPSPYMNKLFDKYFKSNLIPLYETTRGCPFSCTFCTDGTRDKNKIRRYAQEAIDKNLEYIAKNSTEIDVLTMADSNFGMYSEDIRTAKKLECLKKQYHYPSIISVAAGKSKFDNILKTIDILDGSWIVNASVQSTDGEVLNHIQRKNLPQNKMSIFAELAEKKGSESFSEVILCLPMDTKEKHFNSLKAPVDAGINSLRTYQLMLLRGTEISSEKSRISYSMRIKYRVMPGCCGRYEFFGGSYNIAELEEIVVANSTLSYEDYIDCRVMNLFIEIFINGSTFNELFNVLDYFNISRFDCILRIQNKDSLWSGSIIDIVESFKFDTQKDLFDSYEEAQEYVKMDDTISNHLNGSSGNNEILDHKAQSYLKYSEFAQLILDENNLLNSRMRSFMYELKEFLILLKGDFRYSHTKKAIFSFDFSAATIDQQINSFKIDMYKYNIYHSEKQKNMIDSLLRLYSTKNMMGFGRLIQKSNMKLLYRKFEVNPVNQE